MNMDRFNEGYEAYFNGMDITDNPYRENTQLFLDWEAGYFQALDVENGRLDNIEEGIYS